MFKRLAPLWLMLTLTLLAASGFWDEVIQTEKRFYASDNATPVPNPVVTPKERNATVTAKERNATLKSPDLSQLADEKIAAFNRLLGAVKERPYEVEAPHNPFYDPLKAEQRKARYKTRIAVNRQYGYDKAVIRDEMALLELESRERIYNFFTRLAQNWTDMSEKDLQKLFHEHAKWLESINIGRFVKAYKEALGKNDKISAQIVENYRKLQTHYRFFDEFLDYLSANPSLLNYRSLLAMMRLDEVINQINGIETFAKLNTHLRHLHTDMGRLLIFLLIMLAAWMAAFALYYKLYAFLKGLIEKEYDESDEMLLSNLDGIRRPFFILVLAYGFRLGTEVLFHPLPLPENLALFFYAVTLGTVTYVVLVILDSIFFDYLVKKGELKNKQLRRELVNLVVSIIKAVIVVVAVSMLLVRMGVNITGVIASLGIGGLAVALAAQNTLSNFFGLLKIIFDKSFSQGDWIETKDAEGTVVEIGFISTMIRTFDNALITVPNATLANTPLKNWSKRSVGRRIKMHIGVTYGAKRTALTAAVKEIEEMLKNHPGIANHQEVDSQSLIERQSKRERKLVSLEDKYGIKTTLLVYLDEFADSSINILIYCFSKSVVWQEWLEVKQDVMLKIWEILERHGLEFAFPSESIYFDPDNMAQSFASLPFVKKEEKA